MLPGDAAWCWTSRGDGQRRTMRRHVRVEFIPDAPGATAYPLSGRVAAPHIATTSHWTRATECSPRRRYPYDPTQSFRPINGSFRHRNHCVAPKRNAADEQSHPRMAYLLSGGSSPRLIYELIYTAKDPKVKGLGTSPSGFHPISEYRIKAKRTAPGTPKGLRLGPLNRQAAAEGFRLPWLHEDGRRTARVRWRHAATSPAPDEKWMNHRSPIRSCRAEQYEAHFNIADSFPFSYAWSPII